VNLHASRRKELAVHIIRYLSRINGGKSRRVLALSAAAIALTATSIAAAAPAHAGLLRPADDPAVEYVGTVSSGPILEHACRVIASDVIFRGVLCADLLLDGNPQAEAICTNIQSGKTVACLDVDLGNDSYYGLTQLWLNTVGGCYYATCPAARTFFYGIWLVPAFTANFWAIVTSESSIELPDGTTGYLQGNLGSGHANTLCRSRTRRSASDDSASCSGLKVC
jgi:hypothetical protein